jgi:hypothetical protein
MKKNDQKRGLQAPANRAAERAMSRIIEGRNGTGDMVNANRDNKIARLVKAARRDAQRLT